MSAHKSVICKHEGKKCFWETGIYILERIIIKPKLVRQSIRVWSGFDWL